MNLEKLKESAKSALEAVKEDDPNKSVQQPVTPEAQPESNTPQEAVPENQSLLRKILNSKITHIFVAIVFIFVLLGALFDDPAEVQNIRSLKVAANPKVTWGEAIDGSFDKVKWKVESTKKDNIKKVYFSGVIKSRYNSDKPFVEAVMTYREIPESGKFRITIDHLEGDGEAVIGADNFEVFNILLAPYALEDQYGTNGKKK
jgi:hypothetical protein